MSKGNMLLGHARGKVGDLVFSRSNGQQIVRARAAVVKNPQTEKQMIQRIILNTIAQAYSKMQAIVDHSFEGVQAGQKTMSAFLKRNMQNMRSRIAQTLAENYTLEEAYAFSPIGTNIYSPNAFTVSMGSLPSADVRIVNSDLRSARLTVGGTTYADVLAAMGLQRGDQLTFVQVNRTSVNDRASLVFYYSRIILDPTNADGTPAELTAPLLVDGAVNLPSPRNTGTFQNLSIVDGELLFGAGENRGVIANAGVIVSRQGSDGSWLRSNCTLAVNDDGILGMVYSMGEALSLFRAGDIDTLSDLYLNNAGTGRIAGGSGEVVAEITAYIGPRNMNTDGTPTGTAQIVGFEYPTGTLGRTLVLIDSAGVKRAVSPSNPNTTIFGRVLGDPTNSENLTYSDAGGVEGIDTESKVYLPNASGSLAEWLITYAGWSQRQLNSFFDIE